MQLVQLKPNLSSIVNQLYLVDKELNMKTYEAIAEQICVALGDEWFIDEDSISGQGHICLATDEGKGIYLHLQPTVNYLSEVRLLVQCDWQHLPPGAIAYVPKDELDRKLTLDSTQINKGLEYIVEQIQNKMMSQYQATWEETLQTHEIEQQNKTQQHVRVHPIVSILSKILGGDSSGNRAYTVIRPKKEVEVGVEVLARGETVDVTVTGLPAPVAKVLLFFLKNSELYA